MHFYVCNRRARDSATLAEASISKEMDAISAENVLNMNSFTRISPRSECTVARQSGSKCAGGAQNVQHLTDKQKIAINPGISHIYYLRMESLREIYLNEKIVRRHLGGSTD